MLKCLIALKDHINVLCTKAQINGFHFETFEIVEKFILILDRYEQLHLKFQSRNTLLSSVIPSLLTLKKFLVQFQVPNLELQEVRTNLLNDFEYRFQEIFNIGSQKFNLIYALSTYLDPSVKLLLNLEQCFDLKELVESHLHKIVDKGENDLAVTVPSEYEDLYLQLEFQRPNHNELNA